MEGCAESEEGLDVTPAADDLDYDVQPEGGLSVFGAGSMICGCMVVDRQALAVDRRVLRRGRRGSLLVDRGVLLD